MIVVSDLKGNFKDNSTIIVWGAGGGAGTGTPFNENGNVIGSIINGYAGYSDVPAVTMPYEVFIEQINLILASYENQPAF
ncbi:MAG: hypothetical protein LBT25_03345 [Candidatus Symbiothrix sp.]|jgi:hypothetical protein|nr:hypothetical protein [Candidatus Symbiothrix sp.]